MPRPPRDERRAQLARTGRQWGLWLRAAMAESNIDTKALVERAGSRGATFDRSNVSKWRAGDNTADPTNAVTIARVLGRDPADALRAAGHDVLAADWARGGGGPGGRWHAWLLDAAGSEAAILELAARSQGAISPQSARAWAEGDESASPVAAILAARLLNARESEALEAAGHGLYAGVFAALAPPAPVLNGDHYAP